MTLESVAIFSPSPLVTVTIEETPPAAPEIHFHAGGQGVWVARMVRALECDAVLCAPIGGESGLVLRALVEFEGITLRHVATEGENGGYVHDRRGGERREVVRTSSHVLSRHELDELYGTALAAAVEAGVVVLTGPAQEEVAPAATFGRFASDAHAAGASVVADLSAGALKSLTGGVAVLKVAHDEIVAAGLAPSEDERDLCRAMRLLSDVAETVVVSRGAKPALVLARDEFWDVEAPQLSTLDHRGAGDSMTAAFAVGLRRGLTFEAMLQLAAGAGALNVTRRGLGTGRRSNIEALAKTVKVARRPG